MDPNPLLLDAPLTTDGVDRFRRGPLARRLADLVRSIAASDESMVFAVIGAWGSGKTSLLHMMEGELKGDVEVVRFNPWLVGSVDDLLRDFFATLAESIPDDAKWGTVRETIASYGRVAAPVLRIVPGAAAVADLVDVLTRLNDPRPLGRLRDEAEAALRSAEGAFVVVIDDIDRLQPDELLVLLKLIRLVGRLPKVHYVLAFDEATLLDVLGSTAVAGSEARALEYLEKIIQVRVDIPNLHPSDIDSLVGESLERVLRSSGVTLGGVDLERFQHQYERLVRPGLRQPRQVARLFAQVQTVLPLVEGEVDVVDLFLLTYLRMTWPSLYGRLPGWADNLTSSVRATMRERTVGVDARRREWEERLQTARIPLAEQTAAADLMIALFPGFASAFGKTRDHKTGPSGIRRVGAHEYFFRYFQLGIPADDVSDQLVSEGMHDLWRGQPWTPRVGELRSSLQNQPELVFDKMLAERQDSNAADSGGVDLVVFLLEARSLLARRHDLLRPRTLFVDHWVASIACGWPDDEIEMNLETAGLMSLSGVSSLVRGLRWLAKDDENERADLLGCERIALNLVERLLKSAAETPIESDELPLVLATLAEMGYQNQIRSWLDVTLDLTAWTTTDFAGCFVPILYLVGGDGIAQLGDLAVAELSRVVPLAQVIERLAGEIDEADGGLRSVFGGDTSMASRRAHAIGELKRLRDDRLAVIPDIEDSPIASLGPGQSISPFLVMDIHLRAAISLPEPIGPSMSATPRWTGEPLENLLGRLLERAEMSAWLDQLASNWGPPGQTARWRVQASPLLQAGEALFTEEGGQAPRSGIAARTRMALRTETEAASRPAAVEIVVDLGINLKELGADRRPSDIRYATTPPPAPAALKLAELVEILERLAEGAEEVMTATQQDLHPTATEGHVGVWVHFDGGEIDRYVDLSGIERRPGAATNGEYFRAAPWPLPTSTLDPPTEALARSTVASVLQRAGYRDFKDALERNATPGDGGGLTQR